VPIFEKKKRTYSCFVMWGWPAFLDPRSTASWERRLGRSADMCNEVECRRSALASARSRDDESENILPQPPGSPHREGEDCANATESESRWFRMDSTLESRRILPSRNYRDGCSRQGMGRNLISVLLQTFNCGGSGHGHAGIAARAPLAHSIAGREKFGAVG
jgi:hypothetical protein